MDLRLPPNRTLRIEVADPSAVGDCRRIAANLAALIDFSPQCASDLSIVISEATTNLIKHAGGGELLLQSDGKSVEVFALDAGPGMADPTRCMEDGYSTAGSPGQGLGAIRRLARDFEIFSKPGALTLLYARVGPENKPLTEPATAPAVGVCVPYPTERFFGDGWFQKSSHFTRWIMVVDGLGHGAQAEEAATIAGEAFAESEHEEPARMLEDIHRAMRSTRGGVAAIARWDGSRRRLAFAGIGNITGHLFSAKKNDHLVSHNGALGAEVRRFHQFEYELHPDSILVMHSDGVTSRWDLDLLPGVRARRAILLAAAILKSGRRGRDDATVVVLKDSK